MRTLEGRVYTKRKSKKEEEGHEPLPRLYITFSRKKMVERMRKGGGERARERDRERERSWRMKRKAACRGQIKEELAKKENGGRVVKWNARSAALTLESLKTRSSFWPLE